MSPFNAAMRGTPEVRWAGTLKNTPEWNPSSQSLLVVSPHPDDEVFGVGGLMRSHAVAGHDVVVISVTSGEAAYEDWAGLRDVRRRELECALDHLAGGRIELVHLGIPDGRVQDFRLQLLAALHWYVKGTPTIVAPYEFDGHSDHEATAVVCGELARNLNLPLIRYPIWAWHQTDPAIYAGHQWAKFSLDPCAQEAKSKAIACFESQLCPEGRDPIVASHVLEYFERSFEAFLV